MNATLYFTKLSDMTKREPGRYPVLPESLEYVKAMIDRGEQQLTLRSDGKEVTKHSLTGFGKFNEAGVWVELKMN